MTRPTPAAMNPLALAWAERELKNWRKGLAGIHPLQKMLNGPRPHPH